MSLVRRHHRVLRAVFAEPARGELAWADVERLLRALGAELSEGRGSRVRVHLQGVRAVFHGPHPRPDTGRGMVRALRRFLAEAGVHPPEEER